MTGYVLDDREIGDRVHVSSRILVFSTSSRPALRSTQPLMQRVPEALFPSVKRPGREADHSLPASAEVKKMWIHTSTPPYAFSLHYNYLASIMLRTLPSRSFPSHHSMLYSSPKIRRIPRGVSTSRCLPGWDGIQFQTVARCPLMAAVILLSRC
jgi:hypothetical protein